MFHDDPSPDATAARTCHAPCPTIGAPSATWAMLRGHGSCAHTASGRAVVVVTKFNWPRKSVPASAAASGDTMAVADPVFIASLRPNPPFAGSIGTIAG